MCQKGTMQLPCAAAALQHCDKDLLSVPKPACCRWAGHLWWCLPSAVVREATL